MVYRRKRLSRKRSTRYKKRSRSTFKKRKVRRKAPMNHALQRLKASIKNRAESVRKIVMSQALEREIPSPQDQV